MIVLVILLSIALFIKLVLLLGFLFNFKSEELISDNDVLPTVSILIAARNEEAVLRNCIESLLKLDYPQDKIEILLGDDNSTDKTGIICSKYVADHDFIHSIPISEDYHGLIAKANVIAQLAGKARGTVLAITDADMEVSASWLRSMVSPTVNGYDLVSGFSIVKPKGFIAKIQRTDWLNGIFTLKVLADMKQPVTVLGNNMLITNKAYKTIGGFETIGPTATEDNDITIRVVGHGFEVYQHINDLGATTEPIVGAGELFSQRRRWILGGLQHNFFKVAAMFISRSFLLWAIILCLLHPLLGFSLLALFIIMELTQLWLVFRKSKASVSVFAGLITPFFNSVFDTFALLKILFSRKVMWKERKM